MSDITYIVYETIHRLIEYRGYTPDPIVYQSPIDLERAFKKTDPVVISGTGAVRNIRVLLVQSKDVLAKQKLPNIIASVSDKNDDIIIVNNKQIQVSYHNAMKEAEKMRTSKRKIWYMTYDHLKMVIPEYCLYGGPARILSEEEKNEVSSLNRIIPSCFMYIREYEPLTLWLGGLADDVIEIRGPSETGGESIAYRYVIPQERYTSK
jgi:DNA-directed RNA polymerase subunit H (RpoH/RPB5)